MHDTRENMERPEQLAWTRACLGASSAEHPHRASRSPTFTHRTCRALIPFLACALCTAVAPPLAADEPAEPDEPDEPVAERARTAERAPVCDTQIKLGATLYLHETPDQSLAMFRTPKDKVAGLYRRGMYVDEFEIIAVEPRGVLLARGDAYCWLRLQPDPSRPQAEPPPRPRKSKPKKPKPKR